jgi:DNA-binding response OmpR family regulator
MAAAQKILVIDDDKTFTTMVASLLHAAGYRTVVAFDAMQGFMFAGREARRDQTGRPESLGGACEGDP